MSSIALRTWARRSRRLLALVVVLLGIAGAVGVHHAMPDDIMGSMKTMHGAEMGAIGLAVAVGSVAIVGTVIDLCAGRDRDWAPISVPWAAALSPAISPPWPRARAGPLFLRTSVLRL